MDQAQRLRELVKETQPGAVQREKTVRAEFPRCISITSGKGGVGKSNIALYLATAFAENNKKVLLVDADLGLANVHILLGLAPKRSLVHFLDDECPLTDVVTEIMPGCDLLPGASGIEKLANSNLSDLSRLQQAFQTLEKNYDTLIIDTGAGIGHVVTHFASSSDTALVVMTPEPTSLADAYAMVKVLHEHGTRTIGIIVNMVATDREGTETFDRLHTLVVKFLKRPIQHYGTLPFYNDVGRAVRRQQSLMAARSNSAFSIRINGMARRLHGNGLQMKKSFFERLFSRDLVTG